MISPPRLRLAGSAAAAAAVALVVAGCAGSTSRTVTVPRAASTTFDNSAPWPKRVASTPAPPPASSPQPASAGPPAPPIVRDLIPFGDQRKQEMVAYAERHYGISSYQLTNPHVIVEHYTETPDFQSAYSTFAEDVPDVELHELPGTCAHFIVDPDGTIHQLVPVTIMCRHTVGLNWTAIGIENVGMSDGDVMGNAAELHASLALTRWLRCTLHIEVQNVIGHNESLSSPYHHELVQALQTQTHQDMQRPTMDQYRRLLEAQGC